MKGIQFTIEKTTSQIQSILIKPQLKLTPDIFEISFGKFCMQALHIAELIINNYDLQKHLPALFQKLIGKLKQSRSYKPSCQQQQQQSLPIQNDEIYQFMNARKPIQGPKNIGELNWYADHMLKKQRDTSVFMEYMSTVKAPQYSQNKSIKVDNKYTQTDLIWVNKLIIEENTQNIIKDLLASIPEYAQSISNKQQRCKSLQIQLQEINKKYMQLTSGIQKQDQRRLQTIKQDNQLMKKQNKGRNLNINKNKKRSQTNTKRGTFYKQKQIQKDKNKQKQKDNIRGSAGQKLKQIKQQQSLPQTKQIKSQKQYKCSSNQQINKINQYNSPNIDQNKEIKNIKYLNANANGIQYKDIQSQTHQTHIDKINEVIQNQNSQIDNLIQKIQTQKQIDGRFSMDEQLMNNRQCNIERQISSKNRTFVSQQENNMILIQSFTQRQIQKQKQKLSSNRKTFKQRDIKIDQISTKNYNNQRQSVNKDLSFRNTFHNSSFFVNINPTNNKKQKYYHINGNRQQKLQKQNIERQLNNRQNYVPDTNIKIRLDNIDRSKNRQSFYNQKIKMKTLPNKFATKIKPLFPNIGANGNSSNQLQNLPQINMSKQQKMTNHRQNDDQLSHQLNKIAKVQDQSINLQNFQQQLSKLLIPEGRIIQQQELIKKDIIIIQKISELHKNQKRNHKKIKFYVELLQKLHRKFCGKQCKHLQRYYKQIKNIHNWNNRIVLNLPTRQIGFFS